MGRLFRLRRLLADDRGAIAAIVGLAIIPLFAAIGLAVDSARGYMLKSKLSYAIDAAGLAGGRAFETDLREDDIMMFFEANFPPGYMDSQLAPGHPVITFDDEENTVTIVASATIPTAFMSVAGVDHMTVSARTVIKRELRGMELVLVMDNTGSMRTNGGMTAMKPAATALVDILYGDRETVPNFWVGVVPYAATVNIGPQHDDWLITQAYDEDAAWQRADPDNETQFGYHEDHYQPTTWKGCVEAREAPRDSNDDTPGDESWYPFLWRTTLNRFENPEWPFDPDDYVVVVEDEDDDYDDPDNIIYQQGEPAHQHDEPEVVEFDRNDLETWGPYVPGDNEWNPDGPASDLKLNNDFYQNRGTGPNLGCGPAITPLVASKSTIQAAIDEMAPWHRGGTMANLGLAWGWRVLSPRWRGLWDGDLPDELPLDYAEPNMEKVIILLTDGNNEWYDWPGPRGTNNADNAAANCGEGNTQVPMGGLPGDNNAKNNICRDELRAEYPGGDYSAYGRLSEGRLGTTNTNTAKTRLNERMAAMCETMKDQGIIMYTMTFGPSPNAATQTLYRNCATEPDMYFHAPTGTALQQAFVTIADELSKLRIAE
jgi:Flp pilus assembly protein TadG